MKCGSQISLILKAGGLVLTNLVNPRPKFSPLSNAALCHVVLSCYRVIRLTGDDVVRSYDREAVCKTNVR